MYYVIIFSITKYDLNCVKNYTAEDKQKNDSELWSKWLQKYIKRLYSEFGNEDINVKNEQRASIMNSVNPR